MNGLNLNSRECKRKYEENQGSRVELIIHHVQGDTLTDNTVVVVNDPFCALFRDGQESYLRIHAK